MKGLKGINFVEKGREREKFSGFNSAIDSNEGRLQYRFLYFKANIYFIILLL